MDRRGFLKALVPAGLAPTVLANPSARIAPIAASTPGDPPRWRAGMALYEWKELPNTSAAYAEKPAWRETGLNSGVIGFRSVMVAWVGASIDTRDSTVYSLCPGGHSTYRGNFALKLKLSVHAPVMEEAAPTSPASAICTFVDSNTGSTRQCRVNHDGRPPSAHTYYTNQFIERLDRAMLFGTTALHPTGGFRQIVSLNPAINDYEPDGRYPDLPIGVTPDSPICKHPLTEKVYKFVLNHNRYSIYDPATNSWSQVSAMPFFSAAQPVCVDTRRNRLFHPSADSKPQKPPFTMDLASNTFKARTLGGLGAATFTGTGWGMVFVQHPTDPSRDCFLLRNDYATPPHDRVYRINAETFVVDELSTTGGQRIAATGKSPRCYNKFLFAPRLGVCVYLCSYSQNAWVLRVV